MTSNLSFLFVRSLVQKLNSDYVFGECHIDVCVIFPLYVSLDIRNPL